MSHFSGHLRPCHFFAHVSEVLLVLLKVSDHGIKSVNQYLHLIVGFMGNGYFEIAEADFFCPCQKFLDRVDDHSANSTGEEKDSGQEKYGDQHEKFDQPF